MPYLFDGHKITRLLVFGFVYIRELEQQCFGRSRNFQQKKNRQFSMKTNLSFSQMFDGFIAFRGFPTHGILCNKAVTFCLTVEKEAYSSFIAKKNTTNGKAGHKYSSLKLIITRMTLFSMRLKRTSIRS